MKRLGMRKWGFFLLAISQLTLSPIAASAAPCGWDSAKGWIARENQKAGSPNWADGIPVQYSGDYSRRDQNGGFNKWIENGLKGKRVEGWFDAVSATCGQSVGLHLSGNAAPIKIYAYRLGFYGGNQARLVAQYETKKPIPANDAPIISSAPRSTVTTSWPTAFEFKVNRETPPGQYLFKLEDGIGIPTFVPLMITNPEASHSLTFVSSVMTWQAYNQWGGYSLYKGPNLTRASRARVVSFNRPYDGDGSGQTRYMEAPIIEQIEKLGLDTNFATDYELDFNAPQIKNANTIIFGGHAEYWTNDMRSNLESAIARGANLINFGGNAGYNRIRTEEFQRLAMWRKVPSDPYGTNKDLATVPWRLPPINKPESLVLGSQYIGLGVSGSYKINHPDRWPFNAMIKPDLLEYVVGREVDSPLYSAGPAVEVLATSKIKVHRVDATAMATYYTTKSGAGILNMSTNGWVCSMANLCPWHSQVPARVRTDLQLVTAAILRDAERGPLAKIHPMVVDLEARTTGMKFSVEP